MFVLLIFLFVCLFVKEAITNDFIVNISVSQDSLSRLFFSEIVNFVPIRVFSKKPYFLSSDLLDIKFCSHVQVIYYSVTF